MTKELNAIMSLTEVDKLNCEIAESFRREYALNEKIAKLEEDLKRVRHRDASNSRKNISLMKKLDDLIALAKARS